MESVIALKAFCLSQAHSGPIFGAIIPNSPLPQENRLSCYNALLASASNANKPHESSRFGG
jgi:hypothetical protein